MAYGRPGGFSDSEDSDEDFFFDKPKRPVFYRAVNQQDTQKTIENELQQAITTGDLNKTLDIIQTKLYGNVNSHLSSGWTPLIHACFQAQLHIVDALLRDNVDVNLHGASMTPLMAACSNEPAPGEVVLGIVTRLVEEGSLINLGDMYGSTALMKAVINGRAAVVEYMLQHDINIEMRDLSGWTALFWAVHHNHLDIVQILIEHDARFTELDKSGRTPMEIAVSHNHEEMIELLRSHAGCEEHEELEINFNNNMSDWKDYYPGVVKDKPTYTYELQNLLYGMNCERLAPTLEQHHVDLHSLLLLDEAAMLRLGVELPYERKRLKLGLRKFHCRDWRVKSVAGLYAQNDKNYSVLDCLTTLGSHLLQAYTLEATLSYALRDYAEAKVRSSDANLVNTEADDIMKKINGMRKEINILRTVLNKISSKNPPPADLIRRNPSKSNIFRNVTKLIVVISIGCIVYKCRCNLSVLFNK